jgi:hypothetical protein
VKAYSSQLIGAHDKILVSGKWKMGLFVQHLSGLQELVSMPDGDGLTG